MYSWPLHYPDQCPPIDAAALSGQVFRFINKKNPTNYDFTSHYERDPDGIWHDQCQARGLSVYKSYEHCLLMRAAVPALRKKLLAVATITGSVGVIANTPSRNCDGHYTWWCCVSPNEVLPFFTNLDEPPGGVSV